MDKMVVEADCIPGGIDGEAGPKRWLNSEDWMCILYTVYTYIYIYRYMCCIYIYFYIYAYEFMLYIWAYSFCLKTNLVESPKQLVWDVFRCLT